MTSVTTPSSALSYRPCERKPSYTAPTKTPSPLRHATSYTSSPSHLSSDCSDSAGSSFPHTRSKTKSGLPSFRFDLASDVTPTKVKRIHLIPILRRADKTIIQSNVQSSIQISIHTSESGTTTSLSSSSEDSGHSEVKRRSTPSSILLPPRSSKPVASQTTNSSKPGKSKASKGRATVNPRASIPERQRHVSFLPPGTNPGPKTPRELHTLLTYSPVRKFARFLDLPSPCIPLSLAYDVSSPPSPYSLTITRTLPLKGPCESSKRSTMILGSHMIAATLSEPATVPPTISQLVLTSPAFPWEVTAIPASKNSLLTSTPNASSTSIVMVRHMTNLDVLHAIHRTLAVRVLPEEWALLKGPQKKRVLKAYEKRCIKAEGGWDEGVRRVDYLCGKMVLVGIEYVRGKGKDGVEPSVQGKMIFVHPPSPSSL